MALVATMRIQSLEELKFLKAFETPLFGMQSAEICAALGAESGCAALSDSSLARGCQPRGTNC